MSPRGPGIRPATLPPGPAIRHEVSGAASQVQPAAMQHLRAIRQVKQTARRAKDGRRFFASARPAPQEPVLITHVPRSSCALPNALRLEEISCLGWGHFRFASLWGESPVLLPNTSFTAFPRASFQPQLSFEKAMSPSFSQWRGRCPNLDSASRAPKVRCTFDEGRRLPPARPGSTPWRFGVFPRSAQKHPIIPTEFVASLKGCLAR